MRSFYAIATALVLTAATVQVGTNHLKSPEPTDKEISEQMRRVKDSLKEQNLDLAHDTVVKVDKLDSIKKVQKSIIAEQKQEIKAISKELQQKPKVVVRTVTQVIRDTVVIEKEVTVKKNFWGKTKIDSTETSQTKPSDTLTTQDEQEN